MVLEQQEKSGGIQRQIAGLDALELAAGKKKNPLVRVWSALWPIMTAVLISLAAWELVVLSGWREPWVLPGPREVLPVFFEVVTTGTFWDAVALTMQRALVGFAL